ncbi:hypothetical protein Agabi119p4_10740 [Agaricus bisporus var. burnettii]|uniref:Uncharacterized protein n=1 Tax=Agaricus bisporus var. burnettii TaxID=192524 RepID=A0A8H7C3I9_AGABI|nr:hypothetical protein Agabi119p4_10740 [Agaricus bisporus var. burnettii]
MNLELIAGIKNADGLIRAQKELKAYMEFVNDVRQFSMDLTDYLEQQRQQLTKHAKRFEADIRKFRNEIADPDGKIKLLLTASAVSLKAFASFRSRVLLHRQVLPSSYL